MTPLRRASLAMVCAVIVLLVFDWAAWWWVTSRMTAMLLEWQAQRASEGIQVRNAPATRDGWPFAAELVLPAVTADAGFATWQADIVRLRLSPWHPGTLGIAVAGNQRLQLGGLPPAALAAEALSADVPLDGGDVVATGRGITVTMDAGALQAGSSRRGVLQIGLVTARLVVAEATVAAARLVVPGVSLPFGGAIDGVGARLHLTMPFASAGDPAQAAAAWARAGGQVVADDVTLQWGPLDARGGLTASLDPAGQPQAAGTVHLTGQGEMIDALLRADAIDRNTARVASTVLSLLATPGGPGGPAVDLPLTLRHGTVSMGAIPLAQIPPLTFP